MVGAALIRYHAAAPAPRIAQSHAPGVKANRNWNAANSTQLTRANALTRLLYTGLENTAHLRRHEPIQGVDNV